VQRSSREVIVVGGGPAGSTLAALLASRGHDVLLLEREEFPRFHVGESLLPIDLPIFERLGLDFTKLPFLLKHGAEFVDERSGRSQVWDFANSLPGTPTHAYQVERAVFDALLLDTARSAGGEIRTRERVLSIEPRADDVEVVSERGRYVARYAVDATGQEALLGRQRRALAPYRDFGRAAVFRHHGPLAPDTVQELAELGNIKVLIVDDGWMWAIPLHGGKLSVGLVRRRGNVRAEALDAAWDASPLLQRLTAGAAVGPSHSIANFSYRNQQPGGVRHACIGDAACFLDPVFSSGVSLAMTGAEHLSELLVAALAAGTEDDPALIERWAERMAPAYQTFSALIHRFYHTRFVDNILLGKSGHSELRRGVMSALAGDVWRDDNRFQRLLNASQRQTPAGEALSTSLELGVEDA
jgi:flavin-dependent dehydrogenase